MFFKKKGDDFSSVFTIGLEERRILEFLPLYWEASVFLSTEETSNPVFTRGGVTLGRVQANIKSLNTV